MSGTSLHGNILHSFLMVLLYRSERRKKHIMFNPESWKARGCP